MNRLGCRCHYLLFCRRLSFKVKLWKLNTSKTYALQYLTMLPLLFSQLFSMFVCFRVGRTFQIIIQYQRPNDNSQLTFDTGYVDSTIVFTPSCELHMHAGFCIAVQFSALMCSFLRSFLH